MQNSKKILERILVFGIPAISCIAFTNGTDPVNLPKLLLLSTVAGGVLFLVLQMSTKKEIAIRREVLIFLILFIIALSIPIIFAEAPFAQQLYGDYSRNNGLIFHLSLVIILMGIINVNSKSIFTRILWGLGFTSLFNMAISIPELFGYEILRYDNVFKTILGAFGNPNFIGAFFAFSSSVPLVILIYRDTRLWQKSLSLAYLILSLYMVVKSNARQGLIIFVLVIFLAFIIYSKTSQKLKTLRTALIVSSFPIALISFLGVIGKGPLEEVLYKSSVTFRGEYWLAGINMFKSNFFNGVGLNSYGDWYRTARRSEALIRPGIDTTTNAAHNVFIDYAATGGILFIAVYLLLLVIVCRSIWKVYSNLDKFDPVWTGLVLAWTGYQVQSIVSIDQIGLAIWGWALSGALISYPNVEPKVVSVNPQLIKVKKKKVSKDDSFSDLLAVFGLAIGLGICLPAYVADVNWKSEIQRPSEAGIVQKTQKWPIVEDRILEGAIALSDNKLYTSSLLLAKKITTENPRSYVGWKLIYENPEATEVDRAKALVNLLKVDPLNPQLTALIK